MEGFTRNPHSSCSISPPFALLMASNIHLRKKEKKKTKERKIHKCQLADCLGFFPRRKIHPFYNTTTISLLFFSPAEGGRISLPFAKKTIYIYQLLPYIHSPQTLKKIPKSIGGWLCRSWWWWWSLTSTFLFAPSSLQVKSMKEISFWTHTVCLPASPLTKPANQSNPARKHRYILLLLLL